eukprot:scpid81426/ scgid19272/ Emopamil-binding protein-like; Emopamil-binding-related protein
MAFEPGATSTIVGSLSVTAIQMAVALLLAARFIRSYKLARVDGAIVLWLIWDSMIHLMLETPFVIISLQHPIIESDSIFAVVWKEYARADARWGVSDSCVVCLEILTCFICLPLCVANIYGICKRSPWRHFVQITVCVMELYGGFMTFGPEWITGSKYLNTSDPLLLWVYLVFFNILWVIVPIGLLVQSWNHICEAFSQSKSKQF